MRAIIAILLAFVFSASGQSFRISQFTKTTNVTDEALFVIAATNVSPATNYSVRYANLKTGITNGLVTTNMLFTATNTLFSFTTNAIATSGGGGGTVSNLNTFTANLPIVGNGGGQLKSISVASNYYILSLTNFVENEQVKWQKSRHAGPLIGFDTFYSAWTNAWTNRAAFILGGGTNVYCGPSDMQLTTMAVNMINDGLVARAKLWGGDFYISVNDGWQGAPGSRVGGVITVNSNLFPLGMPNFIDRMHALGLKVRLYNDLTPKSCCSLEPFTNILVDAQTMVDWKVDALTIDTCLDTHNDEYKRDLHLNFNAALRKKGWKGSYEVHFNPGPDITHVTVNPENYVDPYVSWPFQFNTFQYTFEYGTYAGTNFWLEALRKIDLMQQVIGWLRPGHYPSMGYLDAVDFDGWYNPAAAYYATPFHFGRMVMTMWAMHQSDLIFSANYATDYRAATHSQFQTNDYIYRIQQDTLCDIPTRSVTNGHAEIWSKNLDDGSIVFCVINRTNFATQAIDLNLGGYGARSNENCFLFDIWERTNRFVAGATTTFICPTNSCSAWIFYPQKNLTIPRGNLFIGGTNENGPGKIIFNDTSAAGDAVILKADTTGLRVRDGNDNANLNMMADNFLGISQVLISDGSARMKPGEFSLTSTGLLTFSSTADANGAKAGGIAQSASGGLEANNGTRGTLTNFRALAFIGDGSGLTGVSGGGGSVTNVDGSLLILGDSGSTIRKTPMSQSINVLGEWETISKILSDGDAEDSINSIIYEAAPAFLPSTVAVYYGSWTNGLSTTNKGGIKAAFGRGLNSLVKYGYVLTNSAAGWDSGHVAGPRIYQENGTNFMFYFGGTGTGFEINSLGIGVAYSTDGTNWTKHSGNPILTAGQVGMDDGIIYTFNCVKVGTNYFGFYNGNSSTAITNIFGISTINAERVGLAFATNVLGPWTKFATNPIVHGIAADATVFPLNSGGWGMIMSSAGGAHYSSFSRDLTNWTTKAEMSASNTFNQFIGQVFEDGGPAYFSDNLHGIYLNKPVNASTDAASWRSNNWTGANTYSSSGEAIFRSSSRLQVSGRRFVDYLDNQPKLFWSTSSGSTYSTNASFTLVGTGGLTTKGSNQLYSVIVSNSSASAITVTIPASFALQASNQQITSLAIPGSTVMHMDFRTDAATNLFLDYHGADGASPINGINITNIQGTNIVGNIGSGGNPISLINSALFQGGLFTGDGAGLTNIITAANNSTGLLSLAKGGLAVDLSGVADGDILYYRTGVGWLLLPQGDNGAFLIQGGQWPFWGHNGAIGTGLTNVLGTGIIYGTNWSSASVNGVKAPTMGMLYDKFESIGTNGFASYRSNLLAAATVSFAGGSPVNFTNPISSGVVVYVDGISVTGTVGINGGTVFNSIGQNTVLLGPNEYCTITYTIGTPTATWKPR